MSENNQPIPFPLNPVFNLSDWIIPNIALTINVANQLYLKRAGDSATGLINFNNGLTCAGTCNISCNVLLNGVLGTDRQLTLSYLNLTNANNNVSTTQIYSNINNTYYDNNVNSSSHIFLSNSSTGFQTNPMTLNSANMTISTTNPPTCSATQPSFGDSSQKMPTTAWVQSAILGFAPITAKTYTAQYTTNTSVTLPTDCIGISIRCIGKGGLSGSASNSTAPATTWNAGGAGGCGATVTSNGIIPFTAGHVIQINFNLYTEVLSTTLSYSICRAGAGPNGSNATTTTGGTGGVASTLSSTTNTSIGSWTTSLGTNGPNGGVGLAFQTATYPSTGGTPICQSWNPNTTYGAGQNWNGAVTSNSFQGAAFSILGGICFITYYLK